MKKFLFIILYFIIHFVSAQEKNEINLLLGELDKAIIELPRYVKERESEMLQLKRKLSQYDSLGDQYHIMGDIVKGYLSFVHDSAEVYIQKKIDIAQELENNDYIWDSKLQLSFLYSRSGLFTQAYEILSKIKYNDLPMNLRSKYCWYFIRYYENLIKYSNDTSITTKYLEKIKNYRQLLITTLPEGDDIYQKEIAFKLEDDGEYTKAYEILKGIYEKYNTPENEHAIGAMGMARLYQLMDSGYQERKYLILAAIADIKTSVKENEALLILATYLYKDGDINRAYKYIRVALDDANFFNSRFRNAVIARVHPVIEDTYLIKIQHQRNNLQLYTKLLVSLVLILIFTIFLIFRQNRTIVKVKNNLKYLNKKLSEANLIKEEYIGYFMRQRSEYIDKLDSYRKLINRKIKARQMDEVLSQTSSTFDVDDAIQELFHDFDEVFLKIFPDFVMKVNLLLKEGEEYNLKKGLNTELRVLALIRLGITDTNQIAVFLRNSVQTIYNYRSKLRKKAKSDQDDFEENVKKIGSIPWH